MFFYLFYQNRCEAKVLSVSNHNLRLLVYSANGNFEVHTNMKSQVVCINGSHTLGLLGRAHLINFPNIQNTIMGRAILGMIQTLKNEALDGQTHIMSSHDINIARSIQDYIKVSLRHDIALLTRLVRSSLLAEEKYQYVDDHIKN